MSYMTIIAHCYQCGALFTSNPSRVPSLRLPTGQQVLFCRSCVEAANPRRIAAGLQPIPIAGSYDAQEVA